MPQGRICCYPPNKVKERSIPSRAIINCVPGVVPKPGNNRQPRKTSLEMSFPSSAPQSGVSWEFLRALSFEILRDGASTATAGNSLCPEILHRWIVFPNLHSSRPSAGLSGLVLPALLTEHLLHPSCSWKFSLCFAQSSHFWIPRPSLNLLIFGYLSPWSFLLSPMLFPISVVFFWDIFPAGQGHWKLALLPPWSYSHGIVPGIWIGTCALFLGSCSHGNFTTKLRAERKRSWKSHCFSRIANSKDYKQSLHQSQEKKKRKICD